MNHIRLHLSPLDSNTIELATEPCCTIHSCHILEDMPLKRIVLPKSRSRLVQQNDGCLYGCRLADMEGRFRKDCPISLTYGRKLCDQVKQQFACGGFFTSDELPRYGISRADVRAIYAQMGKADNDGTLIILCAYDLELSNQICVFLIERIRREHECFGIT